MNNENNEMLDIGGKIDQLVDALSLAQDVPEIGESSANLIDIDINQALA